MKPFALSARAVADLRGIARFTERRWGVEQRNRCVKQLDEAFHLIAENPLAGNDCSVLRPGYRKFPQGSHVIFHRPGNGHVIEIVRVLHKSMDVDLALP